MRATIVTVTVKLSHINMNTVTWLQIKEMLFLALLHALVCPPHAMREILTQGKCSLGSKEQCLACTTTP